MGQAVTTVVSPDKKTLLILTSGFNTWSYPDGPNAGKKIPADSTEWVFVFDISLTAPQQKQALPVPNSYSGITFNPDGSEFYVSGGKMCIRDRVCFLLRMAAVMLHWNLPKVSG